jgi:hypothetical protein
MCLIENETKNFYKLFLTNNNMGDNTGIPIDEPIHLTLKPKSLFSMNMLFNSAVWTVGGALAGSYLEIPGVASHSDFAGTGALIAGGGYVGYNIINRSIADIWQDWQDFIARTGGHWEPYDPTRLEEFYRKYGVTFPEAKATWIKQHEEAARRRPAFYWEFYAWCDQYYLGIHIIPDEEIAYDGNYLYGNEWDNIKKTTALLAYTSVNGGGDPDLVGYNWFLYSDFFPRVAASIGKQWPPPGRTPPDGGGDTPDIRKPSIIMISMDGRREAPWYLIDSITNHSYYNFFMARYKQNVVNAVDQYNSETGSSLKLRIYLVFQLVAPIEDFDKFLEWSEKKWEPSLLSLNSPLYNLTPAMLPINSPLYPIKPVPPPSDLFVPESQVLPLYVYVYGDRGSSVMNSIAKLAYKASHNDPTYRGFGLWSIIDWLPEAAKAAGKPWPPVDISNLHDLTPAISPFLNLNPSSRFFINSEVLEDFEYKYGLPVWSALITYRSATLKDIGENTSTDPPSADRAKWNAFIEWCELKYVFRSIHNNFKPIEPLPTVPDLSTFLNLKPIENPNDEIILPGSIENDFQKRYHIPLEFGVADYGDRAHVNLQLRKDPISQRWMVKRGPWFTFLEWMDRHYYPDPFINIKRLPKVDLLPSSNHIPDVSTLPAVDNVININHLHAVETLPTLDDVLNIKPLPTVKPLPTLGTELLFINDLPRMEPLPDLNTFLNLKPIPQTPSADIRHGEKFVITDSWYFEFRDHRRKDLWWAVNEYETQTHTHVEVKQLPKPATANWDQFIGFLKWADIHYPAKY